MPSSTTQSHARSHALLLLQKLLNLRDSASPLTLVLDTIEQSGKPVLQEFMRRAQISKTKIIYISFATLRKPAAADVLVRARGRTADSLRAEIISHYPPGHSQKTLLLIDELNPLASAIPADLALFLSSLIPHPTLALVCLYHVDVPLSHSHSHSRPLSASPSPSPSSYVSPYAPPPLATLAHLATAVLRPRNLHHALRRRQAARRSRAEPGFGLGEGREGVLVGLGLRTGKVAAAAISTTNDNNTINSIPGGGGGGGSVGGGCGGLVLEMELRRRSGRSVSETFVLVPGPETASPSRLHLLSDHPGFAADADPETTNTTTSTTTTTGAGAGAAGTEDGGDGGSLSTFNLGLTEKQRRDRDGVVLPYFDAQADVGGGGGGGRILYDMGREDDFDDEEDEI